MGLSNTRGTFTSADKTFFDGETGRISVKDYFRGISTVYDYYRTNRRFILDKYDINLRYPHLPCAIIGGKGQKLPLELLKIAGKV